MVETIPPWRVEFLLSSSGFVLRLSSSRKNWPLLLTCRDQPRNCAGPKTSFGAYPGDTASQEVISGNKRTNQLSQAFSICLCNRFCDLTHSSNIIQVSWSGGPSRRTTFRHGRKTLTSIDRPLHLYRFQCASMAAVDILTVYNWRLTNFVGHFCR